MKRFLLLLLVVGCVVASAEEGGRLLVITTDALYNSILPLAQWKHAAGLSTRIAKLSETGSDTTSIRNYIRNAWNNWPVKPEYVLLVGSPSSLPARYYVVQHGFSYSSDNIYGDVTDDFKMDIPVGRFPAKSAAQLDLMVAKTLAYARTPDISDTNWMRGITGVCRDAGDDDGPTYWSDTRNAMTLARAGGFVRFDSLASSRGHSAANVVTSINNGTGLVMYRGSATGNWYDPFRVDPAATNNGSRLPVVLSITCETMTLAPGESMVGEAWLKAGSLGQPKGAVAFVGNTHSDVNVAAVRSAMCRGFFTGLFSEDKHALGLAYLRGKTQLITEFPTRTSDYRGFSLLGDPTLDVWTGIPRTLTVSHPAHLEQGPQQLHVTVASAAGPEDSALVCASMDSTVYALGYTNDSGAIDLDISPAHDGLLRLVVSGHNLYPYDTTIVVGQVGVEETPHAVGRLALSAAPQVFSAATRLSWGSDVAGRVKVFDASGRNVACLTANGSGTEWRPAGISSGAYVCVLTEESGRALGTTRVVKLD